MEEIKMPNWLRDFLFIGIGATGLHLSIGNVDVTNITFDLMTIILVSVFTAFFTYGLISFIRDFKEGGFKEIYNKIKQFINDI